MKNSKYNHKLIEDSTYKEWKKHNFFKSHPNNDIYNSFNKLLLAHKKISTKLQNAGFDLVKNKLNFNEQSETNFIGYDKFSCKAKVLKLFINNKEVDSLEKSGTIVFDQSPFYPESGGQSSDKGYAHNEKARLAIDYVYKNKNNLFFHDIEIANGIVNLGDLLELEINLIRRKKIMRNHSATHLLHAALKKIISFNITQKGSMIEADYFRFDFNLPYLLSENEIKKLNIEINNQINLNHKSKVNHMLLKEILDNKKIEKNFQEKYSKKIRVIKFNTYSQELCSGTHVENSKDIEAFLILSVIKKASSIYRIKAITTFETIHKEFLRVLDNYIKSSRDFQKQLKANNINNSETNSFLAKSEKLLEKMVKYSSIESFKKNFLSFIKENIYYSAIKNINFINTNLLKILKTQKTTKIDKNLLNDQCEELFAKAIPFNNYKIIINDWDKNLHDEFIKLISKKLCQKYQKLINIFLYKTSEDKTILIISSSKDVVKFDCLKFLDCLKKENLIINGGGNKYFIKANCKSCNEKILLSLFKKWI